MNQKILVFVYGTLRKHEMNHYLLNDAPCIAQQCWTHGQLFDTGLGYPALSASDQNNVFGELYLIENQQLQTLDQLEDYRGPDNEDNLYNRIKQTVFTDTGSHEAYVYTIHPNHKNILHNQIEHGDWKVYHFLKSTQTFYYFAYGSCMDHDRFKKAKVDDYFQNVSGRGILEGYQLRYTRRLHDGGRADIVEEGGIVEGIVYEVTKECLPYLFRREGVNSGSYRPTIVDVKVNGHLMKNVLTFIVVVKDGETAPPLHYATEIIRGGTGILSEAYIEKIKKYLQERFNLNL